ncbi:flagellar biosynthesis repressor FlbT [Histidinibacterium aquaticum]|uniref:Flagellum biosynthesis protein FlbT n=1 Tax=Histidinibacterium aquaticum TaxID=2613962 RepID=A0A5J5GRG6_9RHOB|nr:flagellar biosynthesis repressor FlbT [Histidinibacterium aquaticum]KAA9009962.1 flagellum biosynthesis protein FlbT [Histidinibacterium aquaticum]
MALKLTLKPQERIVVNGCVMRNSSRRHVMVIETHGDIIRGHDLLEEGDAATPVAQVYFLIQTALTRADLRKKLVPAIQVKLAELVPVFGAERRGNVFEAANYVSASDYYKALRALRPLMKREQEIFAAAAQTPYLEAAE